MSNLNQLLYFKEPIPSLSGYDFYVNPNSGGIILSYNIYTKTLGIDIVFYNTLCSNELNVCEFISTELNIIIISYNVINKWYANVEGYIKMLVRNNSIDDICILS